jgi:hypothetical protein
MVIRALPGPGPGTHDRLAAPGAKPACRKNPGRSGRRHNSITSVDAHGAAHR